MNQTIVCTLALLLFAATGCQQREQNIFSEPQRTSTAPPPGSHAEDSPSDAVVPTPSERQSEAGPSGVQRSPRAEPAAGATSAAPGGGEAAPSRMPPSGSDAEFAGAPSGGAGATWTAPERWESYAPASSMRLANWRLPVTDDAQEPGECAIFQFAGGGDVDANIQRWLAQFKNDAGEPATENARQAQLIVDSVPTYLVRTTGTYEQGAMGPMGQGTPVKKRDYALFGVVFAVETPIFIKCTGPQAVIGAQAEAITEFVRSFRFSG